MLPVVHTLARTLARTLQPGVNKVARACLTLPQDTPSTVLTLPVTSFGWGFPDVQLRSKLYFVLGYHKALESRNVLCRACFDSSNFNHYRTVRTIFPLLVICTLIFRGPWVFLPIFPSYPFRN